MNGMLESEGRRVKRVEREVKGGERWEARGSEVG